MVALEKTLAQYCEAPRGIRDNIVHPKGILRQCDPEGRSPEGSHFLNIPEG